MNQHFAPPPHKPLCRLLLYEDFSILSMRKPNRTLYSPTTLSISCKSTNTKQTKREKDT